MLAKLSIRVLIVFLVLRVVALAGAVDLPAVSLDDPVSNAAPAWLRGPADLPDHGDGGVGAGAWRSLSALLVVVAALLLAGRYLRGKANTWGVRSSERLRVLARLRIGFRQELVVVEWEDRRMMLGVGPAFVRCLDKRCAGSPEVEGEEHSEAPHED